MSRLLLIMAAAFLMTLNMNCKKPVDYTELKAFMNEVLTANEEYMKALETAKRPDDVEKAIKAITKRFESFSLKTEPLIKKYPIMKEMNMTKHPSELNSEFERQKHLSEKMRLDSEKRGKYFNDKKVVKAFTELTKVMMKAKFFM